MPPSIRVKKKTLFVVVASLILISITGCKEQQTECSSDAKYTSLTSFALRYGVEITDAKSLGIAALLKNGQLPSGLTKWDFAHNCLGDVRPFVSESTLLLRATTAK